MKDHRYNITFTKYGTNIFVYGDVELPILREGKIKKEKVKDIKRNDLLGSAFHEDTFLIPHSQLRFFWNYLKKQDSNQVRPRKHFKPRLKYKKTRFSRIYSELSYQNLDNHIKWFKENIDRGLYKKPACLHILHRLKEIAKINWNKVKIEES